ncbi:MAG: dienelactone hydrolase family protein [Chloroflexi bacterium]|nr:dienelactone hydrolase family protein [Chloroflexota bacterium]
MHSGRRYPYTVYLPPGHSGVSSDAAWPVILFLHGAGELGDDGRRQIQVGLGPWLCRYPERYPAIAVLPQCPSKRRWDGDMLDVALQALDEAVHAYGGDPDRLYLTGVSMGGFGTFRLASLRPDRFAAAIPICGGGNPTMIAAALSDVPMWVFHGAVDDIVPVERSRQMVAAIKSAGGNRLRYTELPGVAHNSWDAAYADPELPNWLLSQRLSAR